jgi:hypothetical protein
LVRSAPQRVAEALHVVRQPIVPCGTGLSKKQSFPRRKEQPERAGLALASLGAGAVGYSLPREGLSPPIPFASFPGALRLGPRTNPLPRESAARRMEARGKRLSSDRDMQAQTVSVPAPGSPTIIPPSASPSCYLGAGTPSRSGSGRLTATNPPRVLTGCVLSNCVLELCVLCTVSVGMPPALRLHDNEFGVSSLWM